jgi:hypothetical protein
MGPPQGKTFVKTEVEDDLTSLLQTDFPPVRTRGLSETDFSEGRVARSERAIICHDLRPNFRHLPWDASSQSPSPVISGRRVLQLISVLMGLPKLSHQQIGLSRIDEQLT